MIDSLTLSNFKCFEHQEIRFGGLTLLAGMNGMGKSSVLQGLLVLRQSALERMLPGVGVLLNGQLIRLGTARDVLHEHAQKDEIALHLRAGERDCIWRFKAGNADSDVLEVAEGPGELPGLSVFGTSFQYLAAERIGPRDLYETSDYHVTQRRDLSADGGYTVAFLDAHGYDIVVQPLLHPRAVALNLAAQVDAWLGEVSPGVRVQTQRSRDLNRATMGVDFVTGKAVSRPYRPSGVGFGISYTLPVLLAVLSARPGSLILIENPEAHLHPRGQVAMGRLFAHAAAAGIQVIAETHSDHVLNGVRLAVKRGVTSPESVRMHYFTRDSETIRTVHRVVSPRIDRDGRIDQWPDGFFDQWDRALDELLAT